MINRPLQRLLGVVRRQCDPDAIGPLADERLLARFARNGDASAFELLVWRHADLVYGVCRRTLGDHHAAEDAFQATFLALARKPRAVRTGAALSGWLHRVAQRIAIRARRDRDKRSQRDVQAARPELVSAAMTDVELRAVIDEEIERLPDRFRRAVVLCYLEGATTEQAARMLGCPRGTVLSRLAAAKERLRARLTKRGLALPAGGLAAIVATTETPAATIPLAVKMILGGSASVQVIGWAQGALTAMMLTKIKTVTAVILTVGAMGTGVGWVFIPGAGPATVQAQAQKPAPAAAKPAPARPELSEVDRAKLNVLQAGLDAAQAKLVAAQQLLVVAEEEFKTQAELRAKAATTDTDFRRAKAQWDQAIAGVAEAKGAVRKAEAELQLELAQMRSRSNRDGPAADSTELRAAMAERDKWLDAHLKWDKERTEKTIAARSAMMTIDERLRSLDNEQTVERERMLQATANCRNELSKTEDRLRTLSAQLGSDHSQVKAILDGVQRLKEQAEILNREYRDAEERRLAIRTKLRDEAIRADEQLKSLERRLALEEQDHVKRRAEIHQRLQAIRNAGAAGDSRLDEIDRKLQAIMAELAQMRRDSRK